MDEQKPMGRDAIAALGLLAAMSGYSDTPRRQEPSECEYCHEKGFHALTCYYVVMEAWLAHYKWCKVCKPGVKNVEPSTVLCPRGLKLYRKAIPHSSGG